MNESWWNFVNWWVMLRGKLFYQIYCVRARAKLGATPDCIKCLLPINHERLDGSWWYLHIWLILMRRWSWHKVKGQGQIGPYIKKIVFAYKSWMDKWILMILTHMIDIDETLKLTQGQGHKVKGQGQICNNVKNL